MLSNVLNTVQYNTTGNCLTEGCCPQQSFFIKIILHLGLLLRPSIQWMAGFTSLAVPVSLPVWNQTEMYLYYFTRNFVLSVGKSPTMRLSAT